MSDTKYQPTADSLILEQMPLVVVEYHALQEGFAQLAPRAYFNVVGGEIENLIGSTVTIESLHKKGYRIKEQKPAGLSSQLPAQKEAA